MKRKKKMKEAPLFRALISATAVTISFCIWEFCWVRNSNLAEGSSDAGRIKPDSAIPMISRKVLAMSFG